jgi:hypothetical protein
MNVWRTLHPTVRVAAVMAVVALGLLVAKGVPPIWAAQARTGPAPARAAPACAECRARPAPFRMLPSDLAPGGVSQHAPTKGPFLGSRRDAS